MSELGLELRLLDSRFETCNHCVAGHPPLGGSAAPREKPEMQLTITAGKKDHGSVIIQSMTELNLRGGMPG